MADYLSLADICVAPYADMPFFSVSLPETPLKVVEYMAMGKPVIMSKISDDNVISRSGGGLLVKPGDAFDLAEKLLSLIENENMINMGKKGKSYVEKYMSWEKNIKKVIKIYNNISDDRL